uniref:Protein transport protein SEC24-1 n=1 Tax=Lygus hesperus TaxID=30085 RepID=A0A0A9WIJ5_LYGHE
MPNRWHQPIRMKRALSTREGHVGRLKMYRDSVSSMTFGISEVGGEKRMFMISLVKVALPKERKVEGSRRGKPFVYHLKVEDKQLPVCRPMFLNTFGLKCSTVKSWLADYSTIGTQNNQPHSSEEPCLSCGLHF